MRKSLAVHILRTMRPKQWTKNLVLFAPLIFAHQLFSQPLILKTVGAFFIFCLLSGAVYIVNDLVDLEQDKKHPVKSKRPIPSGQLSRPAALATLAVVLLLSCLGSLVFLNWPFIITALSYLLLQIAYSLFLKHIVIIDVFSIAAGFLLRVIAGAEAINVDFSTWLFFCTSLLALFLALSKRRHELILLDDAAVHHRRILFEYSPELLDHMISIVTTATVIVYILYTISAETIDKFGTDNLKYTAPFVLYGIFRYLYLIHQKNEGGSPEKVLLNDRPLLYGVILYALAVCIILYF